MNLEKTETHHSDVNKEEGIEIPYEQIQEETLKRMIEEFVSRDGADWGDTGGSMENKIKQVLRQLKEKKVRVVFDLVTQTANIVTV